MHCILIKEVLIYICFSGISFIRKLVLSPIQILFESTGRVLLHLWSGYTTWNDWKEQKNVTAEYLKWIQINDESENETLILSLAFE